MTVMQRLAGHLLVADGGMGTQLQRAGLPIGTAGERWNLDHPDRGVNRGGQLRDAARCERLRRAGQPRLEDGRAVYDMGAAAFADGMDAVLRAGAAIVGGCCGTGPDHIRGLRALVDRGRTRV